MNVRGRNLRKRNEATSDRANIFNMLPKDIIEKVASFLVLRDASHFSRCCKTVRSSLSLAKLGTPVELLSARSEFFGEYYDVNRTGPEIPVHTMGEVHTVILTSYWRDQGWGNCKGTLFVVAYDGDSPMEDRDDFDKGRCVVKSPLAGHSVCKLRMEFQLRSNEEYRLWMYVGGGGGHELIFDTALKMQLVGLE